jgi:homoprotocatechuate degradation regulator HpaR
MKKKQASRRLAATTSTARLRDFSTAIPMALLRARQAAIGHFRPVLRECDLTEQQWRVLRALSSSSRIEVLDLARLTFLKPTSLSRILPKLERRGLCRRRKSKVDQRRVLIELAPAGWKLLKKLGPTYGAAYDEITRRFGKQRLALFVRLAREFEAAMAAEGSAAQTSDAL